MSALSIQAPCVNGMAETAPISLVANQKQISRGNHPIIIALKFIAGLALIYGGIGAIGACMVFLPALTPLAVFVGFALIAVGLEFHANVSWELRKRLENS